MPSTAYFFIAQQGDELALFGTDILARRAQGQHVRIVSMGRGNRLMQGGAVRDAAGTPFEGISDIDILRSRDKAFFAGCKALGLEACDIVVDLDRFATGGVTPIAAARALARHLPDAEVEVCVPAFDDDSQDADARALCLGAYLLRDQGLPVRVSRYAKGDYAFWHAVSVELAPAKTPEAAGVLDAAAEAYRTHDEEAGKRALRYRTDPAFLDDVHACRAFRMDEPASLDVLGEVDAWHARMCADRLQVADAACAEALSAVDAVRQEYEQSASYRPGRTLSAPLRLVRGR